MMQVPSVPVMPTGSTGTPDFSIRLTAPRFAWFILAFRLRVPSGKMTSAASRWSFLSAHLNARASAPARSIGKAP